MALNLILLQHYQGFPACVAVHRRQSDTVLSAQGEETAVLPAVGPSKRTRERCALYTNYNTPISLRSASTAATATLKNTSGRTRPSFWPPTTHRTASTTSSYRFARTSSRKPPSTRSFCCSNGGRTSPSSTPSPTFRWCTGCRVRLTVWTIFCARA